MVPFLPQGTKNLWHIIFKTLSWHSAVAEIFVVGILLRVAAISDCDIVFGMYT